MGVFAEWLSSKEVVTIHPEWLNLTLKLGLCFLSLEQGTSRVLSNPNHSVILSMICKTATLVNLGHVRPHIPE